MSSSFKPEGIASLESTLAHYVETRQVPGIVSLISRGNEMHVSVIGERSFEGPALTRDSIFRIASLTKPIGGMAAMMLIEEGLLTLDEPIDRLVPELANRRVLARIDGPLNETVPADRPITVRDALTFRAGFGLLMDAESEYPILKAFEELQLSTLGPWRPEIESKEWLSRLSTLPLMHQPGEKWLYNTSFWILGALLERAADTDLDVLLRERIFEPLGMRDTGFVVLPNKLDRLVTMYELDFETGEMGRYDQPPRSRWANRPAFPALAADLVSTIDDYHRFAQLMRNRGELDGNRLISEASFREMATDQISAEQKAVSPFFPGFWDVWGWGLGMAVAVEPDGRAGAGRFGWDGGYGTTWYYDPTTDLTGIMFSQVMVRFELFEDFWKSAYAALAD